MCEIAESKVPMQILQIFFFYLLILFIDFVFMTYVADFYDNTLVFDFIFQ